MLVQTNNSFTNNTSKEWFKGLLRERVVTVTFTKKDGTERVMKCTLSSAIIPVAEHSDEQKNVTSGQDLFEEIDLPGKKRKVSVDSLPVYDTEANDWRSFRWDSIKSFEFNL